MDFQPPRATLSLSHSLWSMGRATTLQKCGVSCFSVFLCQSCRDIWREILVKFSPCYISRVWVSDSENSGVAPANQRKGQNEKFMNFAYFCEFWCFSLGKQARFTLNFCSGMPLGKVHELTFLWFGLPGALLKNFTNISCQKRCEKRKVSRKFPLLGRSMGKRLLEIQGPFVGNRLSLFRPVSRKRHIYIYI